MAVLLAMVPIAAGCGSGGGGISGRGHHPTSLLKTVGDAYNTRSISVDPERNRLYVMGYHSESLSAVDISNLEAMVVSAQVETDNRPTGFMVSPAAGLVCVGEESQDTLETFDLNLTLVKSTNDPGARSPAVIRAATNSTDPVVMFASDDTSVYAIDCNSHAILHRADVKDVFNLTVDTVSNTVYARANQNDPSRDQTVTVLNGSGLTAAAEITISPGGGEIVADSKNHRVYVGHGNINGIPSQIDVIDGTRNAVIDSISIDASTRGLAVDSDKNRLYVSTLGAGNALLIIDTETDRVIDKITDIAGGPITVDPTSHTVFVSGNSGLTALAFN
ncbi:YncE family protein [Mycolicibacter kumamotonensis]|uniref:YncE family protein n=1 Tax=Mycolicibacter kumamotonensis TaxID=354243 RepID=UPI001042545A|nr:hypothetical protein [Mycolicibacter kumamotonensis]